MSWTIYRLLDSIHYTILFYNILLGITLQGEFVYPFLIHSRNNNRPAAYRPGCHYGRNLEEQIVLRVKHGITVQL
jgi:hypothetical protein